MLFSQYHHIHCQLCIEIIKMGKKSKYETGWTLPFPSQKDINMLNHLLPGTQKWPLITNYQDNKYSLSDIGKGLNDYIRLVDKCNITEEMIPKNWSYFLKWILLKWLGPLLYYFFLRRSNSLISKHIRRLLIYCTHSHSSSMKETESVSQKDKSQKDKKYTFLNSTFSSLWAN